MVGLKESKKISQKAKEEIDGRAMSLSWIGESHISDKALIADRKPNRSEP